MNIFDNLYEESDNAEEEEDNNPFSGTNHMFASGVSAVPDIPKSSGSNSVKPEYEYSDNLQTVDEYENTGTNDYATDISHLTVDISSPISSSSSHSFTGLSNANSTKSISDSSNSNFEPYENLSLSVALAQQQSQANLIQDQKDWEITVIDSGDFSDQWGKHAIGYVIKYENNEVTRRYSEFSSLHVVLTKFFPTIIVPPIPSKHSLIKYFLNPINAQYDIKIIEKRKRKFASFLNNCNNIPDIKNHIIFQKFLNPDSVWKDVMNSPPVTILPLNNLLAPPLNPTKPSPLHLLLPLPNPSNNSTNVQMNGSSKIDSELHCTTNKFIKIETVLSHYLAILQPMLNKIKHNKFHLNSLATQLAELGAFYNALSIENNPFSKLSSGIEKIGHSFDVKYVSMEILIENLQNLIEENIDEIVKSLLDSKRVIIFKNMKIFQYQIIKNTLEKRQNRLTELSQFEEKLARLDIALNRDAVNSPTIAKVVDNLRKNDKDIEESEELAEQISQNTSSKAEQIKLEQKHLQLQYQLQKKRKKLNKYTSKLGSLEPEFLTKAERDEQSRKITKEIEKLNECFKLIKKDLQDVTNSTMGSLLNLVQFIQKRLDFMLRSIVKLIINHITECLRAWKEAKLFINDI